MTRPRRRRGAGCPGTTYGTGEIALVMLDARTGELCYRFDSERLDVDMVVVVDGVLVTVEYDDGGALLVAHDLSDGVERWSVPANYQGARGYLPGIPAGTGGGIITGLGPDGTLEGIALDDGTVRWTADLGVDPDAPAGAAGQCDDGGCGRGRRAGRRARSWASTARPVSSGGAGANRTARSTVSIPIT